MATCLRCGGEWLTVVSRPKVCRFCGSKKWDKPFNFDERKPRQKHGQTSHALYHVWNSMLRRCYKKNHKHYPLYGGRGITVCNRWHDFKLFLADMEGSYTKGLTLDRVDNSQGYKKENCRWATQKEQSRNKSSNRSITIKGKTRILVEWREIYGISKSTVQSRIRRGMTIEEALTTPVATNYSYSKPSRKGEN